LNSKTGEEIAQLPVASPRAALALPGGSVLLAGLEASVRVDPHQRIGRTLDRLSLLPGAELLADPRSPHALWMVDYRLGRLSRHIFDAEGGVSRGAEIEVPGAREAFTVLRGGDLLFASGTRLMHVRPGGKLHELELPTTAAPVWRVLPAHRLDQAWLVTPTGVLTLVDLAARARVVRSLSTGLLPFDIAALDQHIAILSVSAPGLTPIRFSLYLWDAKSAPRLVEELPSSHLSATPDWLNEVTADKLLALGGEPLRVAIGGPHSVRVYEVGSGERLFVR
jgi:hypothetical protein